MAKPEIRQAARRLRQQDGLSIKEIAAQLGVARSSVSTWVRDITLTPQQKARLDDRNKNHPAQREGSRAVEAKHRQLREQYQQEGRIKAREGDTLHSWGCMLYWAEGNKARNMIAFSNSDVDMMCLFIRFLRASMRISDDQICFRINCYASSEAQVLEIVEHWCDALKLTPTHARTHSINARPISSKKTSTKLKWGVCRLEVYDTRAIQHIYGAIQEYTGINKPKWLD
ncbi:helix-turn-helix domain-containing protein [Phototrophicus methaneseepsis]|uniref:Helix-turn-helix domain-containing protein n=1 Tax=Phototrophicus methaneseepsis TaxID=2710758 RepID=A0A7S8IDG2_9CHLR|nr:helix-turn-helix domain-containing protein [Phototrophicus methaneseepsis]QPC81537.1 helix-turn-helix domain-containing protein [Phototrophicus methaneseepsis]